MKRVRAQGRAGAGLAVAAILAVGAAGPCAADAPDPALENAIKATYLYKFGAFVDWPAAEFAASDSPITICVAGRDPFGQVLDKAVAGQRIADRPVAVRRLQTVAPDSGCQILYLGPSDRQPIGEALDAVRGAGVLTVTDAPGGGRTGIVRFMIRDNHVRFDIDDQAATRSGLAISSKLLSLASSFRARAQ